ncbi:MAG: replication-associated recombination protein A [Lewinellaceae bacterium]|nr:replication-associated recombination protein A [Saprospiraceae bacterium]MCB9311731.1 replication-associated recombination protein A [Lewinellaceae bacterium]HRW75086.1 replication-associated recombination protein A [Saprospiraceae bacterium]
MTRPPLAERMRPGRLDEFAGQQHLVGQGAVIRQAVESGHLPSMIFWGPPGVGKTTLARLIASETGRTCIALSAIQSGVKEIRQSVTDAESQIASGQPSPILFIDEIHRFHKGQQDALLGAVEKGTVILIGATTENPSFEVNNALLSRCQVYTLEPLPREELERMIRQALDKDEFLSGISVRLEELDALLGISGGDGRKLYNTLELVTQDARPGDEIIVTNELVMNRVQSRITQFDKGGEIHYDIISAFIKSIRGSDPNAAVYYLARMVHGGQDPLFIARRLIILAAEDIGLANPNALLLANAAFDTVHKIGFPEARIILSEVTIYLACSPKSNAAYLAIDKALASVRNTGDQPVPLHLRNAATGLMKQMGYGKEYQYSHDYPGHFVPQDYQPDGIRYSIFYQPAHNPAEEKFRQFLANNWAGKYDY